MPAQAGFGTLGVFKFYHWCIEDGFFPDTEKAGGNLSDDMIGILNELLRIAPLSCAS